MAINKSYNEDLRQSPHEALYGTILKTVEIGPTSNQTASKFATKMKDNWAAIGARIIKTREKVKEKLDAKKSPVIIKPGDKALLSTKNLTNDKLDTPYIKAFKMVNVKNTTVELSLPDTRIFPEFHAFLIKKAPPDIPLATVWNYSTKEEYEMERILQKKTRGTKSNFFCEMERLRHFRSNLGTKNPFDKRSNNPQTIPKNDIKGKMLRPQF